MPIQAVFRRYLCSEKEYLSFSLIYNNGERSLDLVSKTKPLHFECNILSHCDFRFSSFVLCQIYRFARTKLKQRCGLLA